MFPLGADEIYKNEDEIALIIEKRKVGNLVRERFMVCSSKMKPEDAEKIIRKFSEKGYDARIKSHHVFGTCVVVERFL